MTGHGVKAGKKVKPVRQLVTNLTAVNEWQQRSRKD